jgi:two-component system OmpR family sensor kinase
VKLAPRSLATRVALTTALSVIVASASVALISQLIADRMASKREDETLSDAAGTFALELQESAIDPRAVTADETRELAHAAIRAAVFDSRALLAGDHRLSWVAPDTCRYQGELRTCAAAAGRWVAVVGRDHRVLREQQRALASASWLAVLLTSLIGTLIAIAIARLVIAPLARLKRALEHVPEHDPGSVTLGEASNLIEVDTLRESLRAAFVRLGAALAQSRRFASDAAHELRTPLATLIGELELTAEQVSVEVRTEIARAIKLARRMSTLVDRLLILARVEDLQVRERLEVRELVEEAIDTLAPTQRARVSIASNHETDAAAVDGDRALLVATFVNALENALKFSEQIVSVSIGVHAGQVRISILDLGPGVEDAERDLVFAPFYRTAASRSSTVPGHGIGLALIAHVVSLHGGRARFADCERGAQLDLVLPAASEP